MVEVINTGELKKKSELDPNSTHQVYCGLDSCVTQEVLSVISKQADEETSTIYDFERALQAPVLEMMLRGILTDQFEVVSLRSEYLARKERIQFVIDELAKTVWNSGLNPSSYPQLKEFFYEYMGLPVQYKYEKGKKKLTVNREALEKLCAYRYARPIAKAILAHRDMTKKISVLRSGIDEDGRMRFSYNIGGCVKPSTKVLTPKGWIRIDNFNSGELVAQWEPSGEISFVQAKLHKSWASTMLQYKTTQIKLTVTPEHRVVYRPFSGKSIKKDFTVMEAKNVRNLYNIALPISGFYKGGTYSPENPELLVAALADGTYDCKKCRIIIKKERKCSRLIQIGKRESSFKEHISSRSDFKSFSFTRPKSWPEERKWGSWVLRLTQEAANLMADELVHWDGSISKGKYKSFTTGKRREADWVALLLHLTGRSTVARCRDLETNFGWTSQCELTIKSKTTATLLPRNWTTIHNYNNEVYCLEVPSSFFLVKEDEFISVTGNTNTGRFSCNVNVFGGGTNANNITDELRRIFIAGEGRKLAYLDLEQAESRVTAYKSGDEKYIAACESSDLHVYVAQLIWKELAWSYKDGISPNSPPTEYDRAISEQKFYRHFSYRDLSKRGGHLTNYFGQPNSNANQLKISRELMREFHRAYLSEFSGIRRWHSDIARILQTTARFTTSFGRKRLFFGRTWDDANLRKAIAYDPQSTIGDLLNLGMWLVWKNIKKVNLLTQLYDAILVEYDEEDEDEVIPAMMELMLIPLQVTDTKYKNSQTREMIIPVDASVGWNWGKFHKIKNPDGLQKYKGPEQRKRRIAVDQDVMTRLL